MIPILPAIDAIPDQLEYRVSLALRDFDATPGPPAKLFLGQRELFGLSHALSTVPGEFIGLRVIAMPDRELLVVRSPGACVHCTSEHFEAVSDHGFPRIRCASCGFCGPLSASPAAAELRWIRLTHPSEGQLPPAPSRQPRRSRPRFRSSRRRF